MTDRRPKYRCLVCAQRRALWPTRGPRATTPPPEAVIRRPGKHSNHRHPGEVRFEPVTAS